MLATLCGFFSPSYRCEDRGSEGQQTMPKWLTVTTTPGLTQACPLPSTGWGWKGPWRRSRVVSGSSPSNSGWGTFHKPSLCDLAAEMLLVWWEITGDAPASSGSEQKVSTWGFLPPMLAPFPLLPPDTGSWGHWAMDFSLPESPEAFWGLSSWWWWRNLQHLLWIECWTKFCHLGLLPQRPSNCNHRVGVERTRTWSSHRGSAVNESD